MGDVRFIPYYEQVREASDPVKVIRALSDEGAISALAGASQERDPYLANVLASDLMNRVHRKNTILNTAGEGVCAVDPEGRLTFMNPAAERMLGWSSGEVHGRKMHDVIHPHEEKTPRRGHVSEGERALRGTLHARETVTVDDDTFLRKDASTFPVAYTAAPVVREGEVEGTVLVFRDITDRKKAEKAIVRSRDFYLTLFDEFPTLIWRSGTNGKCDYFNKTWLAFTGRTLAQEMGDGWIDGVHPDDAPSIRREYLKAFHARQPFTLEYRLRRHDGEYRWILDYGRPFNDLDGGFAGYIGSCYDITDRRRAEEGLKEKERDLQEYVDSLSTLTARVATDGRLLLVGKTAQAASGLPLDELMRTPFTDGPWWTFDPDVHARVREAFRHAAAGTPINYDERIRIFGEVRAINFALTPVFDDHGSVKHVIAEGRDITAQKRAEEALRQSEARYRLLAENATDIVASADPEGRITYISPACESALGYAPGEMIGRSVWEYAHAGDLPRVRTEFTALVESGVARTITSRACRKDGSPVWLETTVQAVCGPTGPVAGVVAVARDVTDRKRTEDALRESEERFRSAFAHAAVGMALTDVEGRFLQVNAAYCGITGYTEDDLRSMDFRSVTHPEDIQASIEAMERLLAGEVPTVTLEKRYVHKRGHTVWARTSASVVRDSGGKPVQVIALLQDITEQVRGDESLRREKEFSEGLIRASLDGVLAFDKELRYTVWNPAMERISGKRRDDVLGRHAFDVFPFLTGIGEERFFADALKGKVTVARSRPYRVPETGEEGFFDGHYSPIRDAKGAIIGGLAIIRDVTERERTAAALRESEARLRQ